MGKKYIRTAEAEKLVKIGMKYSTCTDFMRFHVKTNDSSEEAIEDNKRLVKGCGPEEHVADSIRTLRKYGLDEIADDFLRNYNILRLWAKMEELKL